MTVLTAHTVTWGAKCDREYVLAFEAILDAQRAAAPPVNQDWRSQQMESRLNPYAQAAPVVSDTDREAAAAALTARKEAAAGIIDRARESMRQVEAAFAAAPWQRWYRNQYGNDEHHSTNECATLRKYTSGAPHVNLVTELSGHPAGHVTSLLGPVLCRDCNPDADKGQWFPRPEDAMCPGSDQPPRAGQRPGLIVYRCSRCAVTTDVADDGTMSPHKAPTDQYRNEFYG